MIDERTNYVKSYSIGDAWREVMWLCVKGGYDFVVTSGSYVGQIRKQLENVQVVITNPGLRPLAPIMPEGSSIPPPTSDEKIEEEYFPNYLMNPCLGPNEEYRYSTWIVPQIDEVIRKLREYGEGTNQATISVGDKDSIFLSDPPCLRLLDFKVVKGKLNLSVYFRSWDLFSGFPENLGGLQLLKECVLSQIERGEIEDGQIIAYSAGLHLYDQYFDLVNALNVDKIEVDGEVLEDKKKFSKTL